MPQVACEALRDLALLMHPNHPMSDAVRAVRKAGAAVTAASVGLAVDSSAPTTAHNALLQMGGTETVMALDDVVDLTAKWLAMVESDRKKRLEGKTPEQAAEDGSSESIVAAMENTLAWALPSLRDEAKKLAFAGPQRGDDDEEPTAKRKRRGPIDIDAIVE